MRRSKTKIKVPRKKKSRPIKLNPLFWIRNSKEVQEGREDVLNGQSGKCAVSGLDLEVGTYDHNHSSGEVRGVLHSEINLLEGRYLKLFNKLKLEKRFGLTFHEVLSGMGGYLEKDYSDQKLHFRYMTDFRKKVEKLNKGVILSKLKREYSITPEEGLLKEQLVQTYVQAWVDEVEQNKPCKK